MYHSLVVLLLTELDFSCCQTIYRSPLTVALKLKDSWHKSGFDYYKMPDYFYIPRFISINSDEKTLQNRPVL